MREFALTMFAGDRESAHRCVLALYDHAKTLTGMGKRVKLTVDEAEDELTIKQRGFLHKAVFPQIAEQVTFPDGTRYAWQVWKEHFRARFLGDRYVLKAIPRWDEKARTMVKPKRKTPHRERVSTEDLGVKAYSRYIDTVIDTATAELGVAFHFIAQEREDVRYVAPPRNAKEREAVAA